MTEASNLGEPSEDELWFLDALRRAIPADRVPDGLIQRSVGLVSLMDLDRDLAELLESAEPELIGMRGGSDQVEALRFEMAEGGVSIELVLERDAIVGTVLAGDVDQVVLESGEGDLHTSRVDSVGQFELPTTAVRVLRLRLLHPTARPITTDWFLH